MGYLPVLKAKEIIKILKKIGFQLIRKRGSHCFFRHSDGRVTVVPVHSGEDIRRGLSRGILKDIEVLPEEFLTFFKKKRRKNNKAKLIPN